MEPNTLNDIQLKQDQLVKIGIPEFCGDILEGLTSTQKRLPSKYFYDDEGDELFQKIMNCEEYYPFKCELEIFTQKTAELAEVIMAPGKAFDLIELGAGDCTKSVHLLRYLADMGANFKYVPIDISKNIIQFLGRYLPEAVPGLEVKGMNGDYFDMLEKAGELSSNRKVVLFLGSNLGNMPPGEATNFCRELRGHLKPGDLAIIGLDLKKSPKTVLAAYNDKGGITRAFNLNLLKRINRELNADFDLSCFEHYPFYDPETGSCKSYLISLTDQQVTMKIATGPVTVTFAKDEQIFTEISQKYSIDEVRQLGNQASFKTVASFTDQKNWFVNAIWKAI
ncbi:L-histidine N(alpha)-methyltransferase [Mucilaginibacter sp. PAMB04168]|uniref:L-histidine N(alpha)-methyltransferase n=1 Tax=Mucilaginibacter sp. PAMB04168 TaxID=3138567 RepID=UPI0031F65F26